MPRFCNNARAKHSTAKLKGPLSPADISSAERILIKSLQKKHEDAELEYLEQKNRTSQLSLFLGNDLRQRDHI